MTYAGDIQVNRDPNLRKWHGTLLDSDGTPTQCWIYSGTYGVEGGPIDDHHHIINEPHGTLRLMIERSEYVVDSSDLATLEQLLAEWMIGEGVPIPVDMAYTVHMDTLRDEAGDTVIENLPDSIIRQDRPVQEQIEDQWVTINQIQLNDGSHWWNLDGSCLLWGPFVSKSDADTHRTHAGYMG
jgi:hypothetical protein